MINIIQSENSLSEGLRDYKCLDIFIEGILVPNTRAGEASAVKRTSSGSRISSTQQEPVPSCGAHRHFFPRAKLITRLIDGRGYARRSSRVCKRELPICRSGTKSNTQLGSSSFPIVLTSE